MDGSIMPRPAVTQGQLRIAIAELRADADTCDRLLKAKTYDAWSLAYFDSHRAAFRAVAAMLEAQINDAAQ